MSTSEWDAISAFVRVMNANGWPETPLELDALDAEDAAFIVLFEADAMITNGGFGGLFSNPSGRFAGRLPAAAASFSLSAHEAAASTALAIFDVPYPPDFSEREALWDEMIDSRDHDVDDEILEASDQSWYAAEPELHTALARHARSRI
jgi:hypothetical protein